MRPFDVLIVGAGPAGSTAAMALARAGVRVLLVDRASFPRHKLCGDTINPGSLAILDRLGVGGDVRPRAIPVTGMTVTGPRGSVAADYPRFVSGLAIRRSELDLLLVNAAVRAGAVFETGAPVREAITAEGRVTGVRIGGSRPGELLARVIIAADGRHSALGFSLSLVRHPVWPRRWASGAYFTDVDGLSSRGEMHIRGGGYIGVAPLPDGSANVCVVRERRSVREDRSASSSGDPIIEALAAVPELRARFARARRVSATVSLGPLAVDTSACGCPGLLLAGDAAGFIDPMTGDGLRFALRGGELAADAALRELASGLPAFRALRAARAREFSGKWCLNRALRAVVASPRSVAAAAHVAACWSAPVRALVNLAGDVDLVQEEQGRRKKEEGR